MSKCGLCGTEDMATHQILRCKVPFNAGTIDEIDDWMLAFSEFEGCENDQAVDLLRDACTLMHSLSLDVEEFLTAKGGE